MSTPPTKAYLEARLEEAKTSVSQSLERIARLERQIASMPASRWDFLTELAVGDVITWTRVYGPNSVRRNEYQFVAVKRGPNKWQLTSIHSNIDEATLIQDYLERAEGLVYTLQASIAY